MKSSTNDQMLILEKLTDEGILLDSSETPAFKTLVSMGDARIVRQAPVITVNNNRMVNLSFLIGEALHANVQIFLKPSNNVILLSNRFFLRVIFPRDCNSNYCLKNFLVRFGRLL